MFNILPSLASADQLDLKRAIDSVPGASQIHMDIEDGNFIPNITFGMRTVRAVSAYCGAKSIDAHLMVTNPGQYIEELLDLPTKSIAFQVEATNYPAIFLQKIRRGGMRAGLAFNLQTSIEIAKIYEETLDYVLIMTAEPDAEGQKFNPYAISKIARAKSLLPERIKIIVDGAISPDLLPEVISAGADAAVMGRAVWDAEDPQQRYRELIEIANDRYCKRI